VPDLEEVGVKTLLMLAALMTLAACATPRSTLSDAARDLDRAAYGFYDEVRGERPGSDLTRDSEEFAEAAREFSRAVDSSEDRDEIRDEFTDLRAEFHRMRAELDESPLELDERDEFDRLTQVYLDVEAALGFEDDEFARYDLDRE